MAECPFCGGAVRDSSAFCPTCGTQLQTVAVAQGEGLPVPPSARPMPEELAGDVPAIDEKSMFKEIGRYFLPSSAPLIIVAVLFALFLVQGIGIYLVTGEGFFFGLLFAAPLFSIPFWRSIANYISARSALGKLRKSGELAMAYRDFLGAVQYDNDTVRLGNVYCFGRGGTVIAKYEDIRRVWLYKLTVNFIFHADGAVMFRFDLGAEGRLCKLSRAQCRDEWAIPLFAALAAKNPDIEFGA